MATRAVPAGGPQQDKNLKKVLQASSRTTLVQTLEEAGQRPQNISLYHKNVLRYRVGRGLLSSGGWGGGMVMMLTMSHRRGFVNGKGRVGKPKWSGPKHWLLTVSNPL